MRYHRHRLLGKDSLLTFDADVAKGGGNLYLYNGSDSITIYGYGAKECARAAATAARIASELLTWATRLRLEIPAMKRDAARRWATDRAKARKHAARIAKARKAK